MAASETDSNPDIYNDDLRTLKPRRKKTYTPDARDPEEYDVGCVRKIALDRIKKEETARSKLTKFERLKEDRHLEDVGHVDPTGKFRYIGDFVYDTILITFIASRSHPYDKIFRFLMKAAGDRLSNVMSLTRFPKTSFVIGGFSIPDIPGIMALRDHDKNIRSFGLLFKTTNTSFKITDKDIFLSYKWSAGVDIELLPFDFPYHKYSSMYYYNDGTKITKWDGSSELIIDDLDNYPEWIFLLTNLRSRLASMSYTEETLWEAYIASHKLIRMGEIIPLELPEETLPVKKKSLLPASPDHLEEFIRTLIPSESCVKGRELQKAYIDFCKQKGRKSLHVQKLSLMVEKMGLRKEVDSCERSTYYVSFK